MRSWQQVIFVWVAATPQFAWNCSERVVWWVYTEILKNTSFNRSKYRPMSNIVQCGNIIEPVAYWVRKQLADDQMEWLQTLPFELRFSPTGNSKDDLLVVHANPERCGVDDLSARN